MKPDLTTTLCKHCGKTIYRVSGRLGCCKMCNDKLKHAAYLRNKRPYVPKAFPKKRGRKAVHNPDVTKRVVDNLLAESILKP